MFKIKNKKGQGIMGVPFQMIFSLILIAVFIYAAFIGIKFFVESADQAQILQFSNEIKAKVNTIWQTTEASQSYEFNLPSKIELVCFGDLSKEITQCPEFGLYREQAKIRGSNMFFCPPKAAYRVDAEVHLKIDCEGNDCLKSKQGGLFCAQNVDGKVKVRLEKEFGNPNVLIS